MGRSMPASRGADPGGQLTLFELLAWVVAGLTAVIAFRLGYEHWRWLGAIPCGLAGLYVGFVLGQLPSKLMMQSLMRTLRKTETPQLWERLHREYFLSHFIVPILQRERNVPDAELQDFTLGLMLSEDRWRSWHGWRTLNIWFPELAEALK